MPKGFSRAQIVLHWTVALLVLVQFLNDDAIGAAWRAFRRATGEAPSAAAYAHMVVGATILALVLWRLALRLSRGAPAAPADEPRPLRLVAAATHAGLYLALLAVAASGLTAWLGGVEVAAEAHEALTTVLLGLVLLHVAGVLYQRFVLKSDVLARMVRPET